MISVIVPCYNSREYIVSCFNCLQEQTNKQFQAVFIDDCSTDDSVSLLHELKEKASFSMSICENSSNIGAGKSRNVGIEAADGDYVMFLDCDDTIDKTTIERLENVIKNESPDCVLFDFFVVKGAMKLLHHTSPCKSIWIQRDDAILYTNGSVCCKTYKKSILTAGAILFPELKTNEDFVFNSLALSCCAKIYYLNEPLYFYVQNPKSIMHSAVDIRNDSLEQAFGIIEQSGMISRSLITELAASKRFYGETMTKIALGYKRRDIIKVWKSYDDKYSGWKKSKSIESCPGYMRIAIKLIANKKYILFRIYRFLIRIARKFVR